MITSVREGSRLGACQMLGELVGETATRYIYRRRSMTAFVNKRSPSIHIAPCKTCADYRHKWPDAGIKNKGRASPSRYVTDRAAVRR